MTYNARAEFTGPAANYPFAFPYLEESHVKAYVAGVEDSSRTLQNQDPASGGEVVLSVTPGASDEVVIVRETPSTQMVDFQSTAALTEEDLDTANLQSLYVAAEGEDTAALALTTADAVTATVTAAEAAAQAAQSAAETAQTAAEAAQTGAETAETNATAQVALAAAEVVNAQAEVTNAQAEVTYAEEWASKAEDSLVSVAAGGDGSTEYSAKHHALKAAASAAAAAASLSGIMTNQGTFDASGGSLPANVTDSDWWYCAVGGSAGGFDFIQGDMLIYANSTYYKVDNTEPNALFADGSNSMSGNLNMGGNDITNVADVTLTGNGVAEAGMPIVTDAATSRTIGLSDVGSYIRFTSGSAVTVTVPANSTTAFTTGAEVVLFAAGAGAVTVAAAGGVTINSKDAALSIDGQYAAVTLKKVATDEWDLIGALA